MKAKIAGLIILSFLIISCETVQGILDTPGNSAAERQGDNTVRENPSSSPSASPAQAVPESSAANQFEWRVFLLTNIERESRGIPPLQWDNRLGAAARAHTEDMVRNNFLSHTGSDRSNAGQRISRAGFTWIRAAENIAEGQRTPEEVIRSWMTSPGHRSNILDPALSHLGVGFAANKWTQKFATPR